MSQNKLNLVILPNPQKLQIEADPTTMIYDIFCFVADALSIRGNIENWTCFCEIQGRYKEMSETLGSSLQNQTLIINTSDNAKEIKNVCDSKQRKTDISHDEKNNSSFEQIEVYLKVQPNESIQIELDYMTTIQEIFDFLKEEQSYLHIFLLSENTCNWTCFSQEKQQFFVDTHQMLGKQFQRQTLIINTSDNAKSTLVSNQQPRVQVPIQQEIQFCQQHPYCPIQFICAENHNCQRRLCAECQQDATHNQLSISKFQPLERFKCKLRAQAQEALKQKNNCQHLQKKMKNIIQKIQEAIQSQEKSIENEIQKYNDSFSIATDILKTLDKQQILDNSNSALEEMVLILQQNLIQKQGILNSINFKLIEQHLDKVNSIFESFQQQMANLDFIVVPLYQCQVNYDQEMPSIIFNEINLCNMNPQHESYGKYLISQQNLKVEIYNKFQLIETFHLDSSTQITLREIGNAIQQQRAQLPSNIQQWIFFSETKNRHLEEIDQALYQFIMQDHIKINVQL